MKTKKTQPEPNQDLRLEDQYRQTFPAPDSRLMQTLRAARAFRPVERRTVDTVVTYGAYEKPI